MLSFPLRNTPLPTHSRFYLQAIVGFLKEDVEPETDESGRVIALGMRPILLSLAREPNANALGRTWLKARISADGGPNSIVGLSGGPVLGFERSAGGNDYTLFGVQSIWDKKTGLVYGCHLDVIGRHATAALRRSRWTPNRPSLWGRCVGFCRAVRDLFR